MLPHPLTPRLKLPTPRSATAATSRIAILAEGGSAIGFGHLGRCLALTEELGSLAFFAIEGTASTTFVREHGAEVAPVGDASVIVIDRPTRTSANEVRGWQRLGRKVCLIDDLGDGRQIADLVVDPPTAAAWPAANGQRLSGFEHVLLRHEIRNAVGTPKGGHLTVAIGGSDPDGLTPAIADALAARGVTTIVVLGPGYQGPTPKVGDVRRAPQDWPALLAGAEVAVLGYGHTLLEAAYLGVPAVCVVSRPQLFAHVRAFVQHGTALHVEVPVGGDARGAATAAIELLQDTGTRGRLVERGCELVDGAGARRVAEALIALAETS